MDASQYKDYVLVLFIKYISDKYAGVPYAPITIPAGASFKDMVALKGKPDIGDQINKKIIAPLASANKLSDFPDFNDPNKLGSLKGNRAAIAETIENNVRNVIIRDRLTDPAYYEKMSTLLDEIIAARKAKAIEYEQYLKKMGELARDVTQGHSDETPTQLDTPGKRALYNNLMKPVQDGPATGEAAGDYVVISDEALMQALQIDVAVKKVRPDDWRGVQPRELIIKRALYDILKDYDEVERIFKIIFQQHEY